MSVLDLKRLGLTIAMALTAVNIWTGGPLLAVWVGSRAQGFGNPTMGAVVLVIVVLIAISVGLAMLLARLGAIYDEMTGRTPTVRAHSPWLRSMRGERVKYPDQEVSISALDRIMVVMVVLVVLLFEFWFFFLSPSPI